MPWRRSMKLYDFHCGDCGKEFEQLVRDTAEARCPSCKSAAVTKQLSTFSVGGARSADAGSFGGCGSGGCGGGGCGIN